MVPGWSYYNTGDPERHCKKRSKANINNINKKMYIPLFIFDNKLRPCGHLWPDNNSVTSFFILKLTRSSSSFHFVKIPRTVNIYTLDGTFVITNPLLIIMMVEVRSCTLPEEVRSTIVEALKVKNKAYAPYSNFHVGKIRSNIWLMSQIFGTFRTNLGSYVSFSSFRTVLNPQT